MLLLELRLGSLVHGPVLRLLKVVLLLRTWALWNRSLPILIILLITLGICTLATGGAALWASLNVNCKLPHFFKGEGC